MRLLTLPNSAAEPITAPAPCLECRRSVAALALPAAVTLVAAGAIVLLLSVVITDTTFASVAYNEGWNIYHAMRVAQGEKLYDDNLLRVVNYPYLSFYLIGWLGALSHAPLMVARGLSWLGYLTSVVGCAACVRSLGGDRVTQALTAALFAGLTALVVPDFLGVADPQFIAQALSITALAMHLHARTRGTRLLLVPLIIVCSLFTKHQELAVPAAIFVDMAVNHRKDLLLWMLVTAGLGLAFTTAGFLAGDAFLVRLLTTRGYNAAQIVAKNRTILVVLLVPLAVGTLWLLGRCPPRQRPLLATFGAAALACFLGFSGGDGVTRNVAVDYLAWLAIVAGLGATTIPRGDLARAALVLITSFWVVFPASQIPGNLRAKWMDARKAARDFRADLAFLASHPGPAVCETMLLCYEAGRPLLLDPFNAGELVAMGKLPDSALTDPVQRRQIAVIQFVHELRDDNGVIRITKEQWHEGQNGISRFTEGFLRAVWTNYQLDYIDSTGAFYRPRQ